MKYLCRIRYLGTNFAGYQVQPNARTVQGVLNEAFFSLFGQKVAVTGCSRTDSGVHANAFCLTAALDGGNLPLPPERLPLAMQSLLPPDIALYAATAVDDAFHPRYDVVSKTYIYRIYNDPIADPMQVGRARHIRYRLDVDDMNEAAGFFVGKQDFASFMAQGSKVASTVRTVFESEVTRDGTSITFRVRADGFLYNMVRIMVGTLTEVGSGKRAPGDIPHIIAACDRTAAGETAPPDGLYLDKVEYATDF